MNNLEDYLPYVSSIWPHLLETIIVRGEGIYIWDKTGGTKRFWPYWTLLCPGALWHCSRYPYNGQEYGFRITLECYRCSR